MCGLPYFRQHVSPALLPPERGPGRVVLRAWLLPDIPAGARPGQEGKAEREQLWQVETNEHGCLDCWLRFDTEDHVKIGRFIRTLLMN